MEREQIHRTVVKWVDGFPKKKEMRGLFADTAFFYSDKAPKFKEWRDVVSPFWNRERAIAAQDYVRVAREGAKKEWGHVPDTLEKKMSAFEGKLDSVIHAFDHRVALLFIRNYSMRPHFGEPETPEEKELRGITHSDLREHYNDLDDVYHRETMRCWHEASESFKALIKHPLGKDLFGFPPEVWAGMMASRMGRLSKEKQGELLKKAEETEKWDF